MKSFYKNISLLILSITVCVNAQQNKTAEDRMDDSSSVGKTSIGGYGSVLYQNDFNSKSASVNVERIVLFVGHNFGKVSFFSELEVEDSKVEGGEEGGEIALEQAYLKFNLDQNHYITAGLFLPPIGILNTDHLPGSFNGNERTRVETYLIPSTWRELGIGFYGSLKNYPLSYSIALINGLNSAGFKHGSGIRSGRFEGSNASANSLAVTGSLQFYLGDFNIHTSLYYGGSTSLPSGEAESMNLGSGIFGTPVFLGEADMQYNSNGFSFKALGTFISIPDAFDINRVYSNNTPEAMYGAYAEIGYDLLHTKMKHDEQKLISFLRYEVLNLNSSIPQNAISDPVLEQNHLVVGFGYFPQNNVVVKADARFQFTGDQNPLLGGSSSQDSFNKTNTFLNIGIGYSF